MGRSGRNFFCTAFLFFLGAAAGGCSTPHVDSVEDIEPPPPNILLILADDAGYADFGFQGSNDLSTPNLDQLAADGVVFSDAHTTATVCGPSRAGLLTGRYQQRFGYENDFPPPGQGLDLGEKTVAQLLKEHGYRTGAFGKWNLGLGPEYHPNERGFEEFYGFLSESRSYFPSSLQDRPGNPRAVMHNQRYVSFDGYLTDLLAEKTVSFIDEVQGDPFFVYLSFNAVHPPMEVTREDLNRFSGHPRQALAAMTWAMDRAVGLVLSRLDELGIRENTLVFFLSDNGGSAFNNSLNVPLKGWKGNMFEGGHRVPFIFSWPGTVSPGRSFSGLVSALDIVPTILARVVSEEEKVPENLDGVDLFPYILGEREGSPHEFLFWRKENVAAARRESWKLIVLGDEGDDPSLALYNLKEDPGENLDLKSSNPEEVSRIFDALRAWEIDTESPRWPESREWRNVTENIHQALMKNREPGRIAP